MTSPAQLLEDAISTSKRAVQFDSAGQQETAAAYFYKIAAQLLEKAAGLVDDDRAVAWRKKAEAYRSRANELVETKQARENVEIKCSSEKIQLQKCFFYLQQGLEADEAGIKDTAVNLYMQAVELGLKCQCEDPETKSKIKKVVIQALERAEILKGIQKTKNEAGEESQNERKVYKNESGQRSTLHRGFSANLKVTGQGMYTEEEKKVLLYTSKINNNEFVPFMSIDLSERFQYAIPFTDKDGNLSLSPKQRREFVKWVRPDEISRDPTIILGKYPDYYSIKQTIISDCSFVASLAVSAQYEKRFGKQLVTSIIYPQGTDKKPIFNPFGKYMVRLHLNGVSRKVIFDDQLPMGKYGQLLCSYSSNRNELWVSLLEKAYMKVMGGYDFPGSNSNIDLHALTGWIPERVPIRRGEPDFNSDALFTMLEQRMKKGDVLVTAATGELSDSKAEWTGLVSTHAYAVLDACTIFGERLLQLKNPWSHLRWKGNYSELDAKHWTKELKEALNYDPDSAAQFDNGIFWIDFKSICEFYDVIYMNWNPALFEYTSCLHQSWKAGVGPVRDNYNIGLNPQYSLEIEATGTGAVWILLTRHIVDIEDFKDNREYITVLVYQNGGKRVYYPNDPPPYIDGIRINSPHYLCKIILNEITTRKFTLVVSQYEKTQTIYYTLRAYATCPFKLNKIVEPYNYNKQISGSWKGVTAGGCANHPSTYQNNPKFKLSVDSPSGKSLLYIELRGPKQYQIGFDVTITNLSDSEGTAPFRSKSTGSYRSGFVYMELENIPNGDLRIVPSTFLPNQEGPFILTVKSDSPISLN